MEHKNMESGTPLIDKKYKIEIDKEGPLCIYGNPPLDRYTIITNEEGEAWDYKKGHSFVMNEEPVYLCRCGHSKDKPYCDGSHINAQWDPTLKEEKKKLLEEAETYDGPDYQMTDNPDYCVHARICMAKNSAWKAVKRCNDPEKKAILEHEVFRCPSGRLKLLDKTTNTFIEPNFEPSLGLIEDPQKSCSGPLWVRGGIPISVCGGKEYQVRNRVTLCRCGHSYNKPFCDGSHMNEGWKSE